jgi:hypothetical protein
MNALVHPLIQYRKGWNISLRKQMVIETRKYQNECQTLQILEQAISLWLLSIHVRILISEEKVVNVMLSCFVISFTTDT